MKTVIEMYQRKIKK